MPVVLVPIKGTGKSAEVNPEIISWASEGKEEEETPSHIIEWDEASEAADEIVRHEMLNRDTDNLSKKVNEALQMVSALID